MSTSAHSPTSTVLLAVEVSNQLLEGRFSRISLRITRVANKAKKARAVGSVVSKLLAVVQSTTQIFPVVAVITHMTNHRPVDWGININRLITVFFRVFTLISFWVDLRLGRHKLNVVAFDDLVEKVGASIAFKPQINKLLGIIKKNPLLKGCFLFLAWLAHRR